MHTFLIEMLECPDCHHALDWRIDRQSDGHIEQAEAHCPGCAAVYPVRDGIGVFLTPDLLRNDLWEQVDSQLTIYLRDHPQLESQLMDVPLEDLSPTDQHFRALVLEKRGKQRILRIEASIRLYTRRVGAANWNTRSTLYQH